MFWLEMAWIVFFHATKWNTVISIALVFVVVFSGPSRSLSVQDEGALYKTGRFSVVCFLQHLSVISPS